MFGSDSPGVTAGWHGRSARGELLAPRACRHRWSGPGIHNNAGAFTMKKAHLKKLEKAANFLREVYDDLETEGSDDFDEFGPRLDEAAAAIEDILEDVESASKDDDADEGFEVE
ncbi:hypothetical protein DMR_40690 [Solidesulfovibrio magneticus RS-1]|uniref:Uncharacterized protein n=2 Tax=Solidesulfovibrio TaxID=2910984 RepID=C4XP59_SOLM1|nr:hypothetical protein DMR_40690 [Solidesulfovibrio magneticus RS-1]